MINQNEVTILKELCSGLSIMIVEDEFDLANEYKELAQYFFTDITVVNDAKSALEKCKTEHFDIIYTDINMKYMNGLELIRRIKNQDPKQAFIVISASNDSNHLLDLLKLKVSTFILKPFQINEFIDATAEQIAILQQAKNIEDASNQLKIELQEVNKEKKTQEDMLIQQSKLAQAGKMISMIAHQWRQPLSSITTQIAVLKIRLDLDYYDNSESPFEMLSKDLYDSFDKIEKSAIFMSDTINNFRNFYRPNNLIKVFNLTESINSVLEILMLEQNNILIEHDYLLSEKIMVESYESELQQVLMSLLNNARDALIENSIDNPVIKIVTNRSYNSVEISILDNAGGIPKEIMNEIFLPYFSTKSEKNGTGLGLHMAKTIIEEHMDGSLTVSNSKQSKGACFTIKIPIKKEKNV